MVEMHAGYLVEFVAGAAAGPNDYGFVPCYRVKAPGGAQATVFVFLRKEAQYLIDSRQPPELDVQARDEYLHRALLRYGYRQIELALSSEESASVILSGQLDFVVTADNLDLVTALAAEKDCSYQEVLTRDLYCSASGPHDDSRVGTAGPRRIAPTTRALCAGCDLPDTDYICTHLMHPENVGLQVSSGLVQRQIVGALCDAGRAEISSPSGCRPGGHGCWQRIVRTEAPTFRDSLPEALPDAFDGLDSAWRASFGRQFRLLHLPSARNASGLTAAAPSREDFVARMTELADTLNQLRIPDALLDEALLQRPPDEQRGTLNRLQSALSQLLRTEDAKAPIARLRKVIAVRTSLQHSGDPGRLVTAMSDLGVSYPLNWALAWTQIRGVTTEALGEITRAVRGNLDA